MLIGDHAFLSNCQEAALVARDGTIDWYCPKRFDAPSVFASLLDPLGGSWTLRPAGPARTTWEYAGETLVLRTTHRTAEGEVEVLDAIPLGTGWGHMIGMEAPHAMVRVARGVSGRVPMTMSFAPRVEYALTIPRLDPVPGGVAAVAGPVELRLLAPVELTIEDAEATARFELDAGAAAAFVLTYREGYVPASSDSEERRMGVERDPEGALRSTLESWGSWSDMHRTYDGLDPGAVKRSALVLQGLTYQPSGGVVAAPTTSLPEVLGGDRNWDYRYAWLRDATLMMRAQWIAACPDEPRAFFEFIERAGGLIMEDVQIMYGVGGERALAEHALGHLEGYGRSAPVRVGNEAWRQRQLDVLGEVLDAVRLLRDRLGGIDERLAELLRAYADRAAADWRLPDSGMWETREEERHYVSSKVMCWVALDRALSLADAIGAGEPQRARWLAAREEVRAAIVREAWSAELEAFTGAFGSNDLDASVLMMPLVGFIAAGDPRMRSTIEAVERGLVSDGLVRRWASEENAFLICSFWLVECLALAGETERARRRFEQVRSHANDLGLFSEMVEPASGAALGNFPQAFSHVGHINAAWTLTRTARAGGPAGDPMEGTYVR